MSVRVRGSGRDLLAFFALPLKRLARMKLASPRKLSGPANDLAAQLHPAALDLVVREVREETPDTRTYSLESARSPGDPLPFFRAGQYISVLVEAEGRLLSRPFSLSSSPQEALEAGRYRITVRRKEYGPASGAMWEKWNEGTKVRSTGPLGTFVWEPLRDSRELVFLAGGCGVTPFRSLLLDFLETAADVRCCLIYGVARPEGIIFKDELLALARENRERLQVHFVCSEPDSAWDGPVGLLTAERIVSLSGGLEGKSVFACGPTEMYVFLERELAPLRLPRRLYRRESYGVGTLCGESSEQHTILVRRGASHTTIPADPRETVLVALERAGLTPPAECRSGECGVCRARLEEGRILPSPDRDGLRAADRAGGYFHPCSAYPLSDLTVRVFANPATSGRH